MFSWVFVAELKMNSTILWKFHIFHFNVIWKTYLEIRRDRLWIKRHMALKYSRTYPSIHDLILREWVLNRFKSHKNLTVQKLEWKDSQNDNFIIVYRFAFFMKLGREIKLQSKSYQFSVFFHRSRGYLIFRQEWFQTFLLFELQIWNFVPGVFYSHRIYRGDNQVGKFLTNCRRFLNYC